MNESVKKVLSTIKKGPKKGQKGRKLGRNKKKCEKYKAMGMRKKNKIHKLKKHIKDHPNSNESKDRLKELTEA